MRARGGWAARAYVALAGIAALGVAARLLLGGMRTG